MRYRWREANGDAAYDWNEHPDDCAYCGAPPVYQHGDWDIEESVPEEGQCPECGATGLYPLQLAKKEEDQVTRREKILNHAGDALVRVNRVSQVLINVLGVRDGDVEAGALVESVKALDENAARVILNLAKALLALPGEPSAGEEAGDAED